MQKLPLNEPDWECWEVISDVKDKYTSVAYVNAYLSSTVAVLFNPIAPETKSPWFLIQKA